MYCSLDKIDLVVDGQAVAMQTDHRSRAELADEPELTTLFAMARVINARSHVARDGIGVVHYVVQTDVPAWLRDALAATGALLEKQGKRAIGLGPGSETVAGEIADRCFAVLARRAATRVGSRDLAIALRMLEDQTFAAPPARDDELAYWTRVLELAALAGELLRAKWDGRWVQTDRALVPFGFQIAGTATVLFPTNRAQRVVEDGRDESLFKLLVATEETMRQPPDVAGGRLMPSLRHRRDVELDDVVWRPLLADQTPADLPVIVCGIDGESTFGMIRREALGRPADEALDEALANLALEDVDAEHLEVAGVPLVLVTGSFYGSEKLLDRELMRRLHRELGSDLLAAATPTRGVLLVSAAHRDPSQLARFVALVRNKYDDGGGRQISPAIVLLSDGRVAGYVQGPDRRPDTEPVRAETHRETPKKPSLLRRLFGRKP